MPSVPCQGGGRGPADRRPPLVPLRRDRRGVGGGPQVGPHPRTAGLPRPSPWPPRGPTGWSPASASPTTSRPSAAALDAALADADLVVVENLCSLPLNPAAGRAVAACLRGRPAILHHHDLAWQRPHLAAITDFPPDDPAWRHVTINDLSRRQLAERGVAAVTIPNGFDTDTPPGGDRDAHPGPRSAWRPATASSSTPPGPSPARTSPAPSPWPRASTPPTGSSARPRTATAPSSTASWPAASVPVIHGSPDGDLPGRRLRRGRRGRPPVDVGGVRQRHHRGRRPPPPARHRRLPRRPGDRRLRVPVVPRPTTPGRCGPCSTTPTPRSTTPTSPSPAATSPWPRSSAASRRLLDRRRLAAR